MACKSANHLPQVEAETKHDTEDSNNLTGPLWFLQLIECPEQP